jgi:NMD protein affecting ribosome stability and mRNA decay
MNCEKCGYPIFGGVIEGMCADCYDKSNGSGTQPEAVAVRLTVDELNELYNCGKPAEYVERLISGHVSEAVKEKDAEIMQLKSEKSMEVAKGIDDTAKYSTAYRTYKEKFENKCKENTKLKAGITARVEAERAKLLIAYQHIIAMARELNEGDFYDEYVEYVKQIKQIVEGEK